MQECAAVKAAEEHAAVDELQCRAFQAVQEYIVVKTVRGYDFADVIYQYAVGMVRECASIGAVVGDRDRNVLGRGPMEASGQIYESYNGYTESNYGYTEPNNGYAKPNNGGNSAKKGCCCYILFVIVGFFVYMNLLPIAMAKYREKVNSFPAAVENRDYSTAPVDESQGAQRVKLEDGACVRSSRVLEDSLGWLSDAEEVETAMDYFYDRTGVQPYLLICDSIDGKGEEITDAEAEIFLQGLYESLYADEGHMLFVFMEYEESEYITYLYAGTDAGSVMDGEAREMFLNNVDWFYSDSSLSDDAYFAEIFRTSADDIIGD